MVTYFNVGTSYCDDHKLIVLFCIKGRCQHVTFSNITRTVDCGALYLEQVRFSSNRGLQ